MRHLFSLLAIAVVAMFVAPSVLAAIHTEEVSYSAAGKTLKGFLAYDDSGQGKRPGVLVFPEWWGLTQYPKSRAKQLAELGYVAFAADMYGGGKMTDDPKEAGQLAGEVKKNSDAEKQLLEAALDTLKKQPQVDPARIAAIGYCFGGTMALDMARMDLPVKGVVSFHGDLKTEHPAQHVSAKVLALTGEADAFVPPADVENFKKEMQAAGADVQVISYPGAHHSFTNPDADRHHIQNIKYDRSADQKSWEQMKQFLGDLFKE